MNACLAGQCLQLFDGCRSIDVGTDHRDLLPFPVFEQQSKLGNRSGLARALQTSHEDDGRWGRREIKCIVRRAHHLHEFIVHDLDECLTGIECLGDILADGSCPDTFCKVLDDLEGDVGFEQRPTHVSQRIGDVVLGEFGFAGQTTKGLGKTLAEILEHDNQICLKSQGL